MHWYFDVLQKYSVFNGRARRKEYWAFYGWNVLIGIVVGLIEGATQTPYTNQPSGLTILVNLYQLAIVIPSLAVGVRRLHDTGRSGWWLLCPVVNFIFLVQDGEPGVNGYGPDPKGKSLVVEVLQSEVVAAQQA